MNNTQTQRLLSRWEGYIKDMKSRRLVACQERDAAVVKIDTLTKEIGEAQDAYDRAKADAEKAPDA